MKNKRISGKTQVVEIVKTKKITNVRKEKCEVFLLKMEFYSIFILQEKAALVEKSKAAFLSSSTLPEGLRKVQLPIPDKKYFITEKLLFLSF